MTRILIALCCAALVTAAACSGGGSPASPSGAGGATITGTVVRAAASQSAMTVGVAGTSLSSPVDGSGTFQLGGVPPGNVQLVFGGAGAAATVPLSNVVDQDVIELQVAIAGNIATVMREIRGKGKKDDKENKKDDGDSGKNESDGNRPTASPVEIRKFTNGEHVAEAPGPRIPVGSLVTWTYVVTNRSLLTLTSLSVTDDRGVAVACPRLLPAPGQSVTCTGSGVAEEGLYRNVGTVIATANGTTYTDSDASFYVGRDEEDEGRKVQLCHRTGNGSYHMINVSVNAEPAHRRHGDGQVGEAVPGRPGGVFTASCAVR